MREGKSCYTCQKMSFNLMNANCGHKICFQCVKSNKNSYKCSKCSIYGKNKIHHSPQKNTNYDKEIERSTKAKDSETKLYSQNSPCQMRSSRKSLHKSSVNVIFEGNNQDDNFQQIICKEHHEPLTMFCKSSKQLICSVCLCTKSRYNNQIMPIKGAEEFLRKQNKLQRQQARISLSSIENAQKIMKKNSEIFKNCYQSHMNILSNLFSGIHQQIEKLQRQKTQQFQRFFLSKFQQCNEINDDLAYLSNILRQYRQANKQNGSLNELIFVFTSYKVIKNTLKNLDFDYLPYTKEINLIEVNKFMLTDSLNEVIRLKLDLPLKYGQKRKAKSQSIRSVSRSKHEDFANEEIQKQGYTQGKIILKEHRGSVSKRHQMSLCGNPHGVELGEEEKNLYKFLLKSKFKV